MTARAPTPPADSMIVTMTAAQLRDLVASVVQAAIDDVARPAPPALLDTQQIARELGCSEPTVRRLRDEGMPYLRVGESYRYELPACLAWLRSRSGDAA